MKKTIPGIIPRWVWLFVLFYLIAFPVLGQRFEKGVMVGSIKVKFKPELAKTSTLKFGKSGGVVTTGVSKLDVLNKSYKTTSMRRLFRYSPKFEERHKKYGLDQWYIVDYSANEDPKAVVEAFKASGYVVTAELFYEKAEPKGQARILSPQEISTLSVTPKNTSSAPFNDPYLPLQWHYINNGANGGTVGADVNLKEAWKITTGDPRVIVSIHDQGVDHQHKDLLPNMWVNTAELNGAPGVDDDGNGFIDDIYGFNFTTNSGTIDKGEHGTHVAGTVSAVNNNGIGIGGVAGGDGSGNGVRVMSCEILGSYAAPIEESYIYAADNGAIISQNSWGYRNPGSYEQSVLDAIDYFIKEAGNYTGSLMKGGVVIFAAGNDAIDAEAYPGYYSACVTVGALDNKSRVTPYSNYGKWIDIAAPGGDQSVGSGGGILSCLPDNNYGYMDGTSMACPHVSGVAALVVSKFGGDGFTGEMLKKHLLTGIVEIEDIIQPEFVGKMGVGRSDGKLALAEDQKKAPAAISNLQVAGISQDFANLKWSVPADEDDGKPVGFYLYYSKHEISESSIGMARSIYVKCNGKVGDEVSYEITGLESVTDYYFAVKSADRWDNLSALSNIPTARTNSGPVTAVDKETLTLNINVAANAEGQTSFLLSNSGEGVLKWNSEARTVSVADKSSIKQGVKYPVAATGVLSPKQIKAIPLTSNPVEPYAQESTNSELYYFDFYSGALTVGEEDLSLTNSMATRYYVAEADGFNLTHILAMLKADPKNGDPVLEVYKGSDMSTAVLMMSQNISTYTSEPNYYSLSLQEQLFFEQGSYFWIVIHVPAGNKYPLGTGMELEKEYSSYCYYSNSMGTSWIPMDVALQQQNLVWICSAISYLKPFGEFVTLDPSSGVVTSKGNQTVNVSVNAAELIDGTYRSNVIVNTNETGKPMVRIPLTVVVDGHKPVMSVKSPVVDFGSVMVGRSKEIEVSVANSGFAPFGTGWSGVQIASSDPQVTCKTNLISSIPAKDSVRIKFLFKPTATGNVNSRITLSHSDGSSFSFNVFGVSFAPPKAAINPADTTISNLAVGDVINGKFTLQNTGSYPLIYYIANHGDGSSLGSTFSGVNKYGYAATSSLSDLATKPSAEWLDISGSGENITPIFISNPLNRYIERDLGFDFNFFGKKESKVFITSMGGVSFDTQGSFNSTPLEFMDSANPKRFISAFGVPIPFSEGGQVYFKSFPGYVVVQYESIPLSWVDETDWSFYTENVSFQIILSDNGNIRFNYKNFGKLSVAYALKQGLISIEESNIGDGLPVSSFSQPGFKESFDSMSILIESPGMGAVESVSNATGTLGVGESATLNFTVNTDKLYVGEFKERITVLSNDPVNPAVSFPINLSITSGGVPEIEASSDTLKFGDIFRTASKTITLKLKNNGKAVGGIKTVAVDNSIYTVEGEQNIDLKPNSSLTYKVTLTSDVVCEAKGIITFTLGDGSLITVVLEGNVTAEPVPAADRDRISNTLNFGEKKAETVTISNTGNSNLEITPVGNEWISVVKTDVVPGETITNTYGVLNSVTDNEPSFCWIDILSSGRKLENDDLRENFWWDVKLPFTVSFYGNRYDTLHLTNNGLITFTKYSDMFIFGNEGELIPSPKGPNNFIAPMFGFSGPNPYVSSRSGIYVKGNDDMFIIQYQDIVDGFAMGNPITFQVIIYKNGNIKMQYKMSLMEFTTQRSVVGIENADGTEGHQVSHYLQGGVADRQALLYTPVERSTIAPGSSKTLNLEVNASTLFAGDYSGLFRVKTNAPKGDISIPADLKIIGLAAFEAPDSLKFGNIRSYNDPETQMPMAYEKPFTLTNTGTESMSITGVTLDNAYDGQVSVLAYINTWGSSYDWVNLENLAWSLPLLLEPNASISMKAVVTPNSTTPIIDAKLSVATDKDAVNADIAIVAKVSLLPVATLNPASVSTVAATSTHTASHDVTIGNENGQDKLSYSLSLMFDRGAAAATTTSAVAKTSSVEIPLFTSGTRLASTGTTAVDRNSFNRLLEYETSDVPSTLIGLGGGASFYTATRFTAPADGFNLSHIAAFFTTEDNSSVPLQIKVLAGNNGISNATVLHEQEYVYNRSEAVAKASYVTMELDKEVKIYPNENFYVVVVYPLVLRFPQGVLSVGQSIKNTFFYSTGETWNDMTNVSTFESYVYMTKALEKDYQSNAWVTLSASGGSLDAAQSKAATLSFNAANASEGLNKATLILSSDDPINPELSIPVSLYLNQAPRFAQQSVSLEATETEPVNFAVVATDPDGEAVTYSLKGAPAFVTSSGTSPFTLNVNATYGNKGTYTFTVEARDINGNTTELPVNLVVLFKNQAPQVADAIKDQRFSSALMNILIPVSGVFTDPDGDELSFSYSIADPSLVDIFVAESSIALTPKKVGETTLTVTATDIYGASATCTAKLNVATMEEIPILNNDELVVYPTVTYGTIYIDPAKDKAQPSLINIYNLSGALVKSIKNTPDADAVRITINVGELSTGIYMIEAISSDEKVVKQFIKR